MEYDGKPTRGWPCRKGSFESCSARMHSAGCRGLRDRGPSGEEHALNSYDGSSDLAFSGAQSEAFSADVREGSSQTSYFSGSQPRSTQSRKLQRRLPRS